MTGKFDFISTTAPMKSAGRQKTAAQKTPVLASAIFTDERPGAGGASELPKECWRLGQQGSGSDRSAASPPASNKAVKRDAHQTFRISPEQKARLYEVAQERGVSVSDLLRGLVREVVGGK